MEKERLLKWYDYVRQVAGLITSITVILTTLVFITDNPIIKNRILDYVGASEIKQYITELSELVKINSERLEVLEKEALTDMSPAIRFSEDGFSATDAVIGGYVEIEVRYYKLRECGRSAVEVFFENGDGVTHRSPEISVQGFTAEVDPTALLHRKFVAKIPEFGVHPGRAKIWVEVGYTQCPTVPVVKSPIIFFILSEPRIEPPPPRPRIYKPPHRDN